MKKNKGLIAIFVIILILVIDQVSKIWVKTNMSLYESIEIVSWFKIYFVENPGMAFGLELGEGGSFGKLFLSLFRIVAIGFIGYYLYSLVKKGYKTGYIVCIALILAGAFGNIIDSVFYGEIFSASYAGHVASLVPLGEGYAGWLHGKVVDMLYFPLIESTFPTWETSKTFGKVLSQLGKPQNNESHTEVDPAFPIAAATLTFTVSPSTAREDE